MPVFRSLRMLALPLALGACEGEARPAGSDRDDFGHLLAPGSDPRRIVSLNPTTTEILFAIGAGNRLVGRSRWDLHPDSARLIPAVGDAIRPNIEAVLARRPDLVILYASADNRQAAERLRREGIATLALRIDRVADFARATLLLGDVTGQSARAHIVVDTVLATLDSVRASTSGRPRPTVFWHAWATPLITIGGGSFLNDIIDAAGGENIYGDSPDPSPQVSLEDVIRRDPDIILALPNTAARLRQDPRWRALRAVREGRVLAVDSAYVERPSIRLGAAAASLARLLHDATGER